MRCQPQAGALCNALRLQPLQQVQHVVGAADKAALSVVGRGSVKAARLVQHRQQGQADAGVACGAQQALGQRGVVGIGLAVQVVVHVMKFAHRRVPGFQHFDVEPAGDGFELQGRDAVGKLVHQRAPAPEAVLRFAAVFGEATESTLKGVRMQIGHTGDDGAAHGLCRAIGFALGLHKRESTLGVPLHQDILGPAAGQQDIAGKQLAGKGRGRCGHGVFSGSGGLYGDAPLPHDGACGALAKPVGQFGRIPQWPQHKIGRPTDAE